MIRVMFFTLCLTLSAFIEVEAQGYSKKDTVILPAKTEVDFSTKATLNRGSLVVGYRFEISVTQDVIWNGEIIIKKGVETMAEVVDFDDAKLFYCISNKGVPSVNGNQISFDNSKNRVPLIFQDYQYGKRITAGEPCFGKTKRDEKIIIERNVPVKTMPDTCPGIRLRERRLALVIGNANYQINPLDNPLNDAVDVAESLQQLNFHIIFRKNLNVLGILDALEVFRDSLYSGRYDVGLVYFSGHGVEITNNEKTYLVPLEANLTRHYYVRKECIEIGELMESMQGVPIKIVVLDACRNNPWETGSKQKSVDDVKPVRISATGKEGDERIVVYATSSGKTAGDGSMTQRNGDYTGKLKECLHEKVIVFPDVFSCAQSKMPTLQTPESIISCKRYYLRW